ncbi:hypothetical protein V5O48_008916 [Marasmius crinis-equi]|uniref:Uncharacterized protein n=1 Tax=Marasmius crinis-equi TaxID=585013 RepID=A0ABR3FCK0_9AGAR
MQWPPPDNIPAGLGPSQRPSSRQRRPVIDRNAHDVEPKVKKKRRWPFQVTKAETPEDSLPTKKAFEVTMCLMGNIYSVETVPQQPSKEMKDEFEQSRDAIDAFLGGAPGQFPVVHERVVERMRRMRKASETFQHIRDDVLNVDHRALRAICVTLTRCGITHWLPDLTEPSSAGIAAGGFRNFSILRQYYEDDSWLESLFDHYWFKYLKEKKVRETNRPGQLRKDCINESAKKRAMSTGTERADWLADEGYSEKVQALFRGPGKNSKDEAVPGKRNEYYIVDLPGRSPRVKAFARAIDGKTRVARRFYTGKQTAEPRKRYEPPEPIVRDEYHLPAASTILIDWFDIDTFNDFSARVRGEYSINPYAALPAGTSIEQILAKNPPHPFKKMSKDTFTLHFGVDAMRPYNRPTQAELDAMRRTSKASEKTRKEEGRRKCAEQFRTETHGKKRCSKANEANEGLADDEAGGPSLKRQKLDEEDAEEVEEEEEEREEEEGEGEEEEEEEEAEEQEEEEQAKEGQAKDEQAAGGEHQGSESGMGQLELEDRMFSQMAVDLEPTKLIRLGGTVYHWLDKERHYQWWSLWLNGTGIVKEGIEGSIPFKVAGNVLDFPTVKYREEPTLSDRKDIVGPFCFSHDGKTMLYELNLGGGYEWFTREDGTTIRKGARGFERYRLNDLKTMEIVFSSPDPEDYQMGSVEEEEEEEVLVPKTKHPKGKGRAQGPEKMKDGVKAQSSTAKRKGKVRQAGQEQRGIAALDTNAKGKGKAKAEQEQRGTEILGTNTDIVPEDFTCSGAKIYARSDNVADWVEFYDNKSKLFREGPRDSVPCDIDRTGPKAAIEFKFYREGIPPCQRCEAQSLQELERDPAVLGPRMYLMRGLPVFYAAHTIHCWEWYLAGNGDVHCEGPWGSTSALLIDENNKEIDIKWAWSWDRNRNTTTKMELDVPTPPVKQQFTHVGKPMHVRTREGLMKLFHSQDVREKWEWWYNNEGLLVLEGALGMTYKPSGPEEVQLIFPLIPVQLSLCVPPPRPLDARDLLAREVIQSKWEGWTVANYSFDGETYWHVSNPERNMERWYNARGNNFRQGFYARTWEKITPDRRVVFVNPYPQEEELFKFELDGTTVNRAVNMMTEMEVWYDSGDAVIWEGKMDNDKFRCLADGTLALLEFSPQPAPPSKEQETQAAADEPMLFVEAQAPSDKPMPSEEAKRPPDRSMSFTEAKPPPDEPIPSAEQAERHVALVQPVPSSSSLPPGEPMALEAVVPSTIPQSSLSLQSNEPNPRHTAPVQPVPSSSSLPYVGLPPPEGPPFSEQAADSESHPFDGGTTHRPSTDLTPDVTMQPLVPSSTAPLPVISEESGSIQPLGAPRPMFTNPFHGPGKHKPLFPGLVMQSPSPEIPPHSTVSSEPGPANTSPPMEVATIPGQTTDPSALPAPAPSPMLSTQPPPPPLMALASDTTAGPSTLGVDAATGGVITGTGDVGDTSPIVTGATGRGGGRGRGGQGRGGATRGVPGPSVASTSTSGGRSSHDLTSTSGGRSSRDLTGTMQAAGASYNPTVKEKATRKQSGVSEASETSQAASDMSQASRRSERLKGEKKSQKGRKKSG